MHIPPMFKDFEDLNKHYYTAKAIAEEIDYQISEIEELKGHYTIDVTYITFNTSKKCIEISTEFINEDTMKRYSWDHNLKAHRPYTDFIPKTIHQWFENFSKDFKHGIYFNGNTQ